MHKRFAFSNYLDKNQYLTNISTKIILIYKNKYKKINYNNIFYTECTHLFTFDI